MGMEPRDHTRATVSVPKVVKATVPRKANLSERARWLIVRKPGNRITGRMVWTVLEASLPGLNNWDKTEKSTAQRLVPLGATQGLMADGDRL